jgi:HD-GYP domain-containing protein (c-di-GMP phosphodiesterase class II)
VAEVVSLHTIMELDAVRMIQAAVQTVRQISRARDEETGAHLERMARYARLIALRLAPRRGLSDEWVEFLFQFAPLHDVGKIAVPDQILFKPARLSSEEFEVMKTHVVKGCEIVDTMTETFRIGGAPYVRVLRNVVAHHHEAIDGSGYPQGLSGEAISLEGRITAVADVFDALTSQRPYKPAWSIEQAFAFLTEQSGKKFDADAVDILKNSMAAIADIQRQFTETVSD